MKKRIALISACALLVSVFSFAMMPVGAAGPSAFFYRYDSASDYAANVGDADPDTSESVADNLVNTGRTDVDYTHRTFTYQWGANAGGNAVLSYDATVGAMKVTVAENYAGEEVDKTYDAANGDTTLDSKHNPGQIAILAENDVNITMGDYPVFAVMVKLANTYEYHAASTLISTNGTAAMGFTGAASTSAGYIDSTDWQLLVLKVADAHAAKNWKGLIFSMVAEGTHVTAGQEMGWIKWAGAFASEADAQAQFTADGGVLPKVEDTTTKSPLIADYTSKAKFDAAIAAGKLTARNPKNASIAYGDGAAVITYENGEASANRNTGETAIWIDPMNTMAVRGNETVVIKAKASSANFLTYSDNVAAGSVTVGFGGNNEWYAANDQKLEGEDGWLYIALTNKTKVDNAGVAADSTDNWGRVQLYAHGSRYVEDDTMTIAWVGAFKDLETAKYWDKTGSTDKPAYAEKFFFDFTEGYTQAAQQKPNNTATTLVYDPAEKAVKVSISADSPTNDIAPIVLLPKEKTDASIATHPYFAIKVKANGANVTAPSAASHPTKGISWGFGAQVTAVDGYNTYSDGEWTLIVMDASGVLNHATYKEYMGTDTPWLGLIYNFTKNAAVADGTAKDLGWIQWAGVFATPEDARNYFAVTTEQEEELPKKEPTIFADYTTRAKFEAAPGLISFNRYGSTAMTDTSGTKAYDDAKGALVFTTTNRYPEPTNRPDLNINVVPTTDKRLLLKDVNVLAIKSEIGEMADPYATLYAHGIYVNGNGSGDRKGYTTLEVTDSFIFLTIDHAAAQAALGAGYDTATIWGYALFFNSNTYPENGTTIAIEWAGAFDSKEEAEAYTIGGAAVVESVISCTTAGIRKELVDNAQGLRFYQTFKTTIGDDGDEYVNGKKVLTVNVLMATAATVGNNELTVDFAAANAKVANVKISNCRSRVVDGNNVTYVFTALLTEVSKEFKDTDVTCRAYITLEDGSVLYGNAATTSVSKMYNAIGAAKFSKAVQDWMK